MRALYHPAVNYVARTLLKPFSPLIPPSLQFPVTGTINVRLPGDRRIRMAANPTSYVAKRLFWMGFEGYEVDLMRVFIPLARRSAMIFDIGANIGYHSLVAGVYAPDARIVAFEPLPAAHRYLERNLRLNGLDNAVAEQIAISDADGTTAFRAPHNPKFHFVADKLTSTGGLDGGSAGAPAETIQVRTETLDRYVERKGISRIDLIKLDTEASEHRVLAGAREVLEGHRPVILCEVLPGKIEAAIQERISAHRYALFRISGDRLSPVESLAQGSDELSDHLFIPREREDEVIDYLGRRPSAQ
jgi:FkbM family methyltransferase